RPDGFHRRGDRHRLAVPVEDASARGRNFEHARKTRLALHLQEIGIDCLEVDRPAGKNPERGKQSQQHDPCAPDRQANEQGRSGNAHFALSSRFTRRTRRGSGARMPSALPAIFSTRECSPQVLASSCSWPYSMSRLRARSCSRSRSEKSFLALCCEVTRPSAQATRIASSTRFSFATAPLSSVQFAASRCARAD